MEKQEPIVIIDEFGNTTVIDIPDERTLQEVRQWKIGEAASVRDSFIIEGFRPAPFNTKIKLDEATEARLTGAKAYLADKPTEVIYWSLGGGTILELSQGMINLIANQAGAHVQRGFRIYGLICQQINAIATIAELDDFDATAAWLELQNASN